MPNWCTNRWDIDCRDAAQYEEVLAAITGKNEDGNIGFTFTTLKPRPEILKRISTGGRKIDGDQVKRWISETNANGQVVARKLTPEEEAEADKHGGDWYEWSLANWGCKWDASSADLDADPFYNHIHVTFLTPWQPPEAFLALLRERFEDISITAFFDEPGMCAAGYL